MVCFVVSLLKQKIKIVAFVHHGFGGRVELSRGSRVYFCCTTVALVCEQKYFSGIYRIFSSFSIPRARFDANGFFFA